jgi:hypothetical protein
VTRAQADPKLLVVQGVPEKLLQGSQVRDGSGAQRILSQVESQALHMSNDPASLDPVSEARVPVGELGVDTETYVAARHQRLPERGDAGREVGGRHGRCESVFLHLGPEGVLSLSPCHLLGPSLGAAGKEAGEERAPQHDERYGRVGKDSTVCVVNHSVGVVPSDAGGGHEKTTL